MNFLCMFLQAMPEAAAAKAGSVTFIGLLTKGGVMMIPIIILLFLSIYVIIDKWYSLRKVAKNDSRGVKKVLSSLHAGDFDKVSGFKPSKEYPSSKVVVAALSETNHCVQDVEESMQIEARTQIDTLEKGMNWLAISASIAPMIGFLGTIFGVIRIFYDISLSGVIDIPTVSNGLYEKMVCSGSGLFVGIIAYTGYSLLNKWIDKIVLQMDVTANEAIKMIRPRMK